MINKAVVTATKISIDKMENHELASLVMTVSFEYDPRNLSCWNKASVLFSARDANNIPLMHEDVKQTLFTIAKERGIA